MFRIIRVDVRHVGPFIGPTSVRIDPKVTVITGSNDSGKSRFLKLLEAMFSVGGRLDEPAINLARHGSTSVPWRGDPEIGASAELEWIGEDNWPLSPREIQNGDRIFVRFSLAPDVNSRTILKAVYSGESVSIGASFNDFPEIVVLTGRELPATIQLSNMGEPEVALMTTVCGPNFNAETHLRLTAFARRSAYRNGSRLATERFSKLLPLSTPYGFEVESNDAHPDHVRVVLRDEHDYAMESDQRGSGIRRLATLVGYLERVSRSEKGALILCDEPEASLHPGAQRHLRRQLEELAEKPNVQVIYATHSPVMINSLHPERVRTFRLSRSGDEVQTIVSSTSDSDRFEGVRSSLGINPADSLLFGGITVHVEGRTETVCLPHLLAKLAHAEEFKDVEHLLSVCHLVPCDGDRLPSLVRVAKEYKALPVVLLDGDKFSRKAILQRALGDDIPLVFLPEGMEFEQLVPQRIYLDALKDELAEVEVTIDPAGFVPWLQGAKLHKRMAFTKKIERWLSDAYDGTQLPKKVLLMKRAIDLCPEAEIEQPTMAELVRHVRRLADAI